MEEFKKWENSSETESQVKHWYQTALNKLKENDYIPNMAESRFLKQSIRESILRNKEATLERRQSPETRYPSEVGPEIEAIDQLFFFFYGINFTQWRYDVYAPMDDEKGKIMMAKFFLDIKALREKNEML